MSIQVKQQAVYARKDWWTWSVWIEGPDDALDAINFVEYTLHPTFPNPVRLQKDRSTKFRLESAGWGAFTIYAAVHRKDGEVLKMQHLLALSYPEEVAERAAPSRGVVTPKTTLYLLSSSADAPFASVLGKVLEEYDFRVLTPNDFNLAGVASLMKVADQADMALVVFSERTSELIYRDIRYLMKFNVRVILLTMGSPSNVPSDFSDLFTLQIGEVSDLQAAATGVAERMLKVPPA